MTPPARHPYDPGDPYPDEAFQGHCSLLVLLATPDADPEWSAECAVALARQWSERGQRVFLADLALSRPRLHDALGLPNQEGMSDLVLYGASLKRIARPAPDGFLFASAGTPVADPGRVLGSVRWGQLTRGLSKSGAHLMAYLPAGEAGSTGVLAHAERILLLAGANGTDVLQAAGTARDRVAGVLSPRTPRTPRAPRVSGAARSGAEQLAPTAPVSSLVPGAAGAPALADLPHAGARLNPKVAVAAPQPKRYGKPKKEDAFLSSTWRVLLIVGLALSALFLVLAVRGVVPLPWASTRPPTDGDGDPQLTVGVAPAPVGVEADASAASYFLTLGSYAEGVALLQAESLAERRPDLLFVVSPVEVNGEVLHRLLVGETEDTAAAALRESLSRTLSQENPSDWQVRRGPLSFHLGTFETLEAADARVAELRGLSVPAFVLRQPPANPAASERFDVWAGAYADASEATYLEGTLNANGIVPILVRRTGERLPE
jgi:hypothetical protein